MLQPEPIPWVDLRPTDAPSHDEQGLVTIPKGYRWCANCRALTPHDTDKLFSGHLRCIVCDEADYGSYRCDRCGYELGEEEWTKPFRWVTIHHPGCHFQPYTEDEQEEFESSPLAFLYSFSTSYANKLAADFFDTLKDWRGFLTLQGKIWKNNLLTHCFCPRVKVYTNLHVFGNWEKSVYSQDCSNAMEFGCTVRCPVCGYLFEVEDGNC
jgi:hypothetical protein